MRTAALDIGDVWTGIAISDPLGITARPLTTVHSNELVTFLEKCIQEQGISTIVVGHPQTLRGTSSDQTKKVEQTMADLEKNFPSNKWVLWDERMTSKQAAHIKHAKNKEEKLVQHAVAAALILRTYLDSLAWQRDN